jgi:hypothetical protein
MAGTISPKKAKEMSGLIREGFERFPSKAFEKY